MVGVQNKEIGYVQFDVKKASKVAQEILNSYSGSLDNFLHEAPLKEVAQHMFSANLISNAVNESPNYNNLMSEYKGMLQLSSDEAEFMKYCRSFINILSDRGGPLQKISRKIANDWTSEIMKQLHVNLKFTDE